MSRIRRRISGWARRTIAIGELRRLEKGIKISLKYNDIAKALFQDYRHLMRIVPLHLTINQPEYYALYDLNSAFLMMRKEAIETIRMSKFAGYSYRYSLATTMLRTGMEAFISGAFYNTLAKKKFRNKSSSIGSKRRIRVEGEIIEKSFAGELEEVLNARPNLSKQMEDNSAVIFSIISRYQMDNQLWRVLPGAYEMLSDLDEWGILLPFSKDWVYEGYQHLSRSTHASLTSTDVGRRLIWNYDIYGEPEFIAPEFEGYVSDLQLTVEIALALSFNVLGMHLNRNSLKRGIEAILGEGEDLLDLVPTFHQTCKSVINSI
ncbi:MAG: hypothetical protein ACFFFC_16795 [Candidatus Thorarchaeota archaeon]